MKKTLAVCWSATLVFLGGCQEGAVPVDVIAGGQAGPQIEAANTVVDRHGELKNEERFTEFLANLAQEKTDQIRITTFTTEGDPIYQDLGFDGNNIKLVVDATRDKYGSGEVTEMACAAIKEAKSEERTDYVLTGCDNTDGENVILVKWK